MKLLLQPTASLPARHSMIASDQININHRRVWLFYNEIGAVAQCPYNWGVGSAFHPMKIHILGGASLILFFISFANCHSLVFERETALH